MLAVEKLFPCQPGETQLIAASRARYLPADALCRSVLQVVLASEKNLKPVGVNCSGVSRVRCRLMAPVNLESHRGVWK